MSGKKTSSGKEDHDSSGQMEDENGNTANESTAGGIDEYSNGRFDIWKAYLGRLNMTGHQETGITLDDGTPVIHAHNVYVQFLSDHGIIAGVFFILMIICGIVQSIVYCFRRKTSLTAFVPFAVVAGFAFAGLTEWNFQLCNPMTVALILIIPELFFKKSVKEVSDGWKKEKE